MNSTLFQESSDKGISTPYNVVRTTHVTPDFNWEVQTPDQVLAFEGLIGKG